MATRRLGRLASHLDTATAGAEEGSAPRLLSDRQVRVPPPPLPTPPRSASRSPGSQVRQFIADGVLALPVDDLPPEFHRHIHAQGEQLHQAGENPGDGIFPGIPELGDVMRTPTVSGALESLLGPGWSMATHRHMHVNIPAGGNDQGLHKDSQRTKPPLHPPRSIFIFYVPRGATVQMGPTAVVPGGQFVSADDQDWSAVNEDAANLGPGLRRTKPTAPLEQGTIFLAHHGVIHGATARLEDDDGHPWRPM